MKSTPLLSDYAIGAIIIGLISLFAPLFPPVTPSVPPNQPPITTPPVVIVEPAPDTTLVDVPVQLPALVIMDDFEDRRTPQNAAAMRDTALQDKLSRFSPNRWRYWDDSTLPLTPDFIAMVKQAKSEFDKLNPNSGTRSVPTYAIAKGGKVETGKFDATKIDSVLERWSK